MGTERTEHRDGEYTEHRKHTEGIMVDFKKVISTLHMTGEDEEETKYFYEMLQAAENYIMTFKWCQKIINSYIGIGILKVFCVFLFEIEPVTDDVDKWIWVVVGDLPPAYISAYGIPNPAQALNVYIGEMKEWVKAVMNGDDVSELIPVNVEPTIDWAKELNWRLNFLYEKVLSDYLEDLRI